jgi:hypothetical protein
MHGAAPCIRRCRIRQSPRSRCPFGAFVFALRRLSAAKDRPTFISVLNCPLSFRRTYRLPPLCGSINVSPVLFRPILTNRASVPLQLRMQFRGESFFNETQRSK